MIGFTLGFVGVSWGGGLEGHGCNTKFDNAGK